jgi:hypothetical protein
MEYQRDRRWSNRSVLYADLTARFATGRIKPKASRRGRRVRLFAGLAQVVVGERTLTAVDDCRGSRHLAEAVF